MSPVAIKAAIAQIREEDRSKMGVKARRKSGENIPLPPPRRRKAGAVAHAVATDSVNPEGEARTEKQRTLTRKQQAKLRVKEHKEDVAWVKKRLRNGSLSAAEAAVVTDDIALLSMMIKDDNSIRSDHPVKKVRSVKPRKTKIKRKSVAAMHLNPKHHSVKFYISPEQRAISKSKDGVVAKVKPRKLKAAIKSKGLSVVGAAPVLSVNKVRLNPSTKAQTSRKDKLSFRFYMNRKAKYSVYALKEKVLKAA